MDKLLDSVFYNTDSPACFAGSEAVYKEAKRRNKKITRKKVDEYLSKQRTYTLHKPARRRLPRNKIIPIGFHTDWQADLCDMQKLKRYNSGYGYILTVIDVLSRYAWAEPVYTKSPIPVAAAFNKILADSGHLPWNLATDQGKEFVTGPFQELCYKQDINHFSPKSEVKCGMVERYNRTLKTRLWKYFTKNGTHCWIDVLPRIVKAINNSRNRITGCTPASVNKDNAQKLWEHLYGEKSLNPKYRFAVGDKVRISRQKGIFEKGYATNFTEEIFTVAERINRIPPVYRLKDTTGEVIDGVFYGKEMVKVLNEDDVFIIEKILRNRIRNGIKEVYVKWKGYPSSQNSWEPASNIVSAA